MFMYNYKNRKNNIQKKLQYYYLLLWNAVRK